MYPDPITPRAHPDLLARVDYDPFKVMPVNLPPAPRVFTTAAHIQRARKRVAAGGKVDKHCFDRLIVSCKLEEELPPLRPPDGPPDWGGGSLMPWLRTAFRNALAWTLTDDTRHSLRATQALRLAAQVASITAKWTGHEHHEAGYAACAYDLLAASGLEPADDNAFRDMLWTLNGALEIGDHRTCNNHNSMGMVGQLSIASALSNRQLIHDVFYGYKRGGAWRYGLIHLLRHDFLADGMQWEGTPGYHMLVLMMVAECFTIMENMGVDLWRREWPSLMQDDGFDEHRGWGPKGNKTLPAAFDALIYQAFPNGDYTLLHDQVLGNLRGTFAWWRIFNKAFEVYGEPRYAWTLNHINGGKPATADGPVPVWFTDGHADVEFVRFEGRDFPAGENPFDKDRDFSLVGKHKGGCSLFPVHGSAVLRSDPLDVNSLGAYLYWGPHWAGHRSPAALHLDIHALGLRATNAPHIYSRGYDEPRHLTWVRSTIAHNTVTVDQQPMFPFDFKTESLWECDHWRDTISDGVLELFQPGADFKAARASNDNVYPGVKLDRTAVLTRDYVLDVYRVTAEKPRLLDWAMHCHGTFTEVAGSEPIDLGQNLGYRHLTDARMHPQKTGWVTVPFTLGSSPARGVIWLGGAPDARLIIAADPEVDGRTPIGDIAPPQPRTSLIVRSTTASALFVSIWGFGTAVEGGAVTGSAGTDAMVEVRLAGQAHRWTLPMRGVVKRG
ncbi:MAG: heparinase II/III family protein [Planctomycetes bacterium]|nr:heparinase II/III family protein [Planctomycetota bacterium]